MKRDKIKLMLRFKFIFILMFAGYGYTYAVAAPACNFGGFSAPAAGYSNYVTNLTITSGGINKTTTGSAGYRNYTTTVGAVSRTLTYAVSVSYSNSAWTTYTAMHVDWNDDGDFLDANEAVSGSKTNTAGTTGTHNFNMTVPSGASLTNVRIRVYNSSGVVGACVYSYGEAEDYELTVSLAGSAPTLSTTAISSITCSTASSGGYTISDNGSSITAKGVCWNTSTNPTISNSKTSNGTGTANYSSSITGLSQNTPYYVRSYATNGLGTSYGLNVPFTTVANRTVGSASSTETVCISSAMTNITHPTTGVTAVGSSSGLPPGVNASYSGNVITLSGTPTASGAYAYTITPTSLCGSATATGTITVDPASVGGSVTTAAAVCSGSNGATLTLAGHTGSVTKWQYSTDNWTTPVDIVNTTTTQAYSNLTAATKYRAMITSGTCAASNSGDVAITVDAVSVGGSISTDATVCSGSNGATLTLSGHTGSITKWQYSTDNWTTPVDIVNTSTTNAYSNITADTKYRAVITNGTCAAANSSEATITVDAVPVGGSISADASVCSGSNGATLTLSGHSGTITRWESSTDNWTSSTNITNSSTTEAYSNLTATTKYKVVMSNGVCADVDATEATITVDVASVGGSISADATVCSGSNSGTLTLSGHTGSITNWESSTDSWTTTTNIVNTSTTQAYTNITATTKYRAVVTSGSCAAANSSEVTVTVDAAVVGGSISADASVCVTSNGATLTLSGHATTITKWQSSTDNWTTPVDIVNTSTTQAYLNLAATTKYRAVVASGVCGSANSSVATITVDAAVVGGSLSTDATFCSGSNGATLTLSGHSGTISKWQSSTDNWTTPADIVNATTTQTYSNLTATTKYRAVMTSGGCGTANSSEATITVDEVPVGGSISSDASVCSGSNSATLTLSGHSGTISKWQSSTDSWTTPVDIVNATTTQVYTNLTATTKYRVVLSNGVCSDVNATEATITVDPTTVAGTVSADASYCSTTNSGTLTLSGNTGSIVRWESSTDNWTSTTTIANTTSSQAYSNLTVTTKYRAVVLSGSCSSANSVEATITISDPLTPGTISF
ncbi:MAG: hypothetical protein ACJAZ2_000782 [Glaciecola sp.]|jgi:hypothetical protein